MAQNINIVALTGNLTKDPELRHTPGGTAVCSMRLAVGERYKDGSTGEWTDRANYFDITVWGNQGEACAQYLAKGRPVAIQGRLQWREWQADDGTKRQAVQVIAERVQFLRSREGENGGSSGDFAPPVSDDFAPASATRDGVQGDGSDLGEQAGGDFAPAASSSIDDDIPF